MEFGKKGRVRCGNFVILKEKYLGVPYISATASNNEWSVRWSAMTTAFALIDSTDFKDPEKASAVQLLVLNAYSASCVIDAQYQVDVCGCLDGLTKRHKEGADDD